MSLVAIQSLGQTPTDAWEAHGYLLVGTSLAHVVREFRAEVNDADNDAIYASLSLSLGWPIVSDEEFNYTYIGQSDFDLLGQIGLALHSKMVDALDAIDELAATG